MPRAKIADGKWTRRVGREWEKNGEWRTDIFKSVLSDTRLLQCCFILEGSSTVSIPADALRRIVEGGRDHFSSKIWGPFNINPQRKTVDGQKVEMQIV